MKKVFFVLALVLLSGLLVLVLFSHRANVSGGTTATVDLSEGMKRFKFDEDTERFAEDVDGSGALRGIYYEKLSPIDGIYYRTVARSTPIKLSNRAGVTVLELKRGVYVCDLQESTHTYEFRFQGLVLRPTWRGVFVIDLMQRQPTVFSYNSFLSADLLDEDGKIATSFTLFPSLLFRYDTENTSELRNADLIRVATIDTIRYVDVRRKEWIDAIFGPDESESVRFFDIAHKDILARISALNGLYKKAQETDLMELQAMIEEDPTHPLFVNPTKKEIVLKNRLLEKILRSIRVENTASAQTIQSELGSILSDMRSQSPELADGGLDLVRRYLYLSTFAPFLSTEPSAFLMSEVPYTTAARGILSTEKKSDTTYQGLRAIYSRYYLTDMPEKQFNARLKDYLDSLVKGKTIEKGDFLYFSFFLTQYLASGPFVPDENTLHIMFYLFAVTDEYYATVANDPKGKVILSTIFYSYNQSFSRLLREFTSTFFDTASERGAVLKSEYLTGDTPIFAQSFLDLFKDLVNTLGTDLSRKQSKFYAGEVMATGSTVRDNYTILAKTHADLVRMRDIILKYPEYARMLALNERNRNAKGILFATDELSRESLEQYLSEFNDINLSTLKIRNDFKQDGYYDVEVKIAENLFQFSLHPDGHAISNVSFIDTAGKKHIFENIAIGLDEKKEQMRMSSNSSDDPKVRYRQDFKNFFKVAFIERDDTTEVAVSPVVPTSDRPAMDTTTQLFIQKELLEKDFKNVANTLPIVFSNIYATIRNGAYVIDLSNISYQAVGGGISYTTEISGKYVFSQHSFSELSLRVKNMDTKDYDFDGAVIRIRPGRIPLQSVEKYFRDVGSYIVTIRQHYRQGASIEIDLAAKQVRIDGASYAPSFN